MAKNISVWELTFRKFGRGWLMTILALGLYVLGLHTPIPNLPAALFQNTTNFKSFSVFWLGLWPWIIGGVLMQLSGWMVPKLRSTSYFKDGHADLFGRPVILLTLVIAVFLGMNDAGALNDAIPTRNEFDLALTLLSMATGTMVLTIIGRIIHDFGVGNGFWTMLMAEGIYRFHVDFTTLVGGDPAGDITAKAVLLTIILLMIIIVGAIWLIKFRNLNGQRNVSDLLWPWMTAGILTWMVMSLLGRISQPEWQYIYQQLYSRFDAFLYFCLGLLITTMTIARRSSLIVLGFSLFALTTVVLISLLPLVISLEIPVILTIAYTCVRTYEAYVDQT